jgi:hypothetical protein
MAFAENLAEFMDTQTGSAETVSLGGVAGPAIFDAEWADALSMGAPQPVLTIVESDFPAIAIGAAATVRGASYTVVDLRPDGQGMCVVVLEGV